jgi:phosphatidate cytidylyltransferase
VTDDLRRKVRAAREPRADGPEAPDRAVPPEPEGNGGWWLSGGTARVLTALVAAPAMVALAYVGGWAWGLLVAAIGLAAQRELYVMAEAEGLLPMRAWGLGLGAALALGPLFAPAYPLAVVGGVGLLAVAPFVRPRERFLEHLAVTVFGALYPTALLAYLTRLRLARGPTLADLDAFFLVLATLFLVWAADIFAYYAGRTFGRHALAPSISPKKTWEGFAGGLAGAVATAGAFAFTGLTGVGAVHLVVLGLLAGVVGPLGDLVESQIKRATGIKDASAFLPGHGGFLDRFDAMAAVVPLAYLYLDAVAGVL